jgi:hypothetical protein
MTHVQRPLPEPGDPLPEPDGPEPPLPEDPGDPVLPLLLEVPLEPLVPDDEPVEPLVVPLPVPRPPVPLLPPTPARDNSSRTICRMRSSETLPAAAPMPLEPDAVP